MMVLKVKDLAGLDAMLSAPAVSTPVIAAADALMMRDSSMDEMYAAGVPAEAIMDAALLHIDSDYDESLVLASFIDEMRFMDAEELAHRTSHIHYRKDMLPPA